jgi:serine/threonine protein kinase
MSFPDDDYSVFLTGNVDHDRRLITDFSRVAFVSLRSGHPSLLPLRSWSIEVGDPPKLNLSHTGLKIWNPPVISDHSAVSTVYQIASGMAYLHSLDLVHWRIRPDDFYIDSRRSIRFRFRFWFPLELEPYTAPELARGLPYTKACDVYSAGALFYELFTAETFSELYTARDSNFPTFCADMLNPDPARRPTFDDLCRTLKQKLPKHFEDIFVPSQLDFASLLAEVEAAVFREGETIEMIAAAFASLPGLSDRPPSESPAAHARNCLFSERRLSYRSLPPDQCVEPGEDAAVLEQALLSFCESLADIPQWNRHVFRSAKSIGFA